MQHPAIAALALELMPETVVQKAWRAQSFAIAFEQYARLRVPGQTSTGDFQVSTSRTIVGNKDAALQAWIEVVGSQNEFGEVQVEGEAAASHTDKWRYWRIRLTEPRAVNTRITWCDPSGVSNEGSRSMSRDAKTT